MKRVLVLALLGSCTSADQSYRDPEGGYTVRYPSGWRIERDRGSAVFSASAEPTVTVAVTSAPRKEAWRKEPRALKSASAGAQTMLETLPDAKVVSEQRVTVGGLPGLVIEIGFSHNGKPYKRRQWVIEGAERMGYVGYTAPVAKWDIAEAEAEAMVGTLDLGGHGS